MKNTFIRILSVTLVVIIIAGLCACSRKKSDNSKLITNRSVTLSTNQEESTFTENSEVNAVAPEGKKNIIDYLNGSFTRFHNFDYDFNKNVTSVVQSFSAGELEKIDGVTGSYQSTLKKACADMMGVGSLDTSYYVGDDIESAFPIKSIKEEFVQSASASAEGDKVIVTLTVKPQSEDGIATVQLLTNDYMTLSSFNEKIREYEATAADTTVRIGSVALRAVIDYSTRIFEKIEITFKTEFYADEMSLAYVKGGPVKGTTLTTVTYKDFDEKR